MSALDQKLDLSRFGGGISSMTLKWIAMITMVIDHVGYVILYWWNNGEWYLPARVIGRIAFPIFCFMLVEGYIHTRNVHKYLLRLAIGAIVSEIPFDLALHGTIYYPEYQNVMFTLFLGLAGITLWTWLCQRNMVPLACTASILCVCLAEIFHTDYRAKGVILIFILFFFREQKLLKYILVTALLLYMSTIGGSARYEVVGALAVLLFMFYNGKKGNSLVPSVCYYAIYPVHLLILGLVNIWLWGW